MRNFGFSYSISQSLKGLWRNRVMSIASILVLVSCMLVLGTFYALNININYNLRDISLLNEVAAFIDVSCDENETEQIRQNILALADEGLVNDVQYISKEDALAAEKDRFKDYPALFETLEAGDNPYRASFVITYPDRAKVTNLEYKLYEISIIRNSEDGSETLYPINKITSHTEVAESLDTLKDGIRNILLGFMAVLFIISLFIIINTIRIAVFTRQKEIAVMRYVGATNGYIAVPFVFEGAFIGLIAGVIAFAVEWLIYGRASVIIANRYRIFSVVTFGSFAYIIAAAFLVIGLFCGVIGSLISISKYLKEKD